QHGSPQGIGRPWPVVDPAACQPARRVVVMRLGEFTKVTKQLVARCHVVGLMLRGPVTATGRRPGRAPAPARSPPAPRRRPGSCPSPAATPARRPAPRGWLRPPALRANRALP